MTSTNTNIFQYCYKTSFFNRTQELCRLREYLAKPGYSLITLTGIGGIGKTRLALECAKDVAIPVYFVPLHLVSKPTQIAEAISNVLSLDFYDKTSEAQLLSFLNDKQLLLILDNYEHLLEDVQIIEAIIRSAPDVKLLVTSREPLNVQAEWQIHVSGLGYPNNLKGVDDMSSVELFIERARNVQADFNLDDEKDDVYAICELAQGMPLAIEIAARWVKFQSCTRIRENLLDLENIVQNVPNRHRTIRAVLDQTWQCLCDEKRKLFQQLMTFKGCFTAEAALNIAKIEPHELATFVDKSILQITSEDRFYFHEMMRRCVKDYLKNVQSAEDKANQELIEPLTPREMEVLSLLADGLRDREIANQLHISAGTVRNPHMINIRQKLNAKNRTEAVLIARECGLITKTTLQNQHLLVDKYTTSMLA